MRAEHEERQRRAQTRRGAANLRGEGVLARMLRHARRRSRGTEEALDPGAEVRIRPASAEEAIVLRQLPVLRGEPASSSTVLVADVDGATAAAFSLDAGLLMSVYEPPARELNELLHLRARQLIRAEREPAPSSDQPSDAPRAGRFSRRSADNAPSQSLGDGS